MRAVIDCSTAVKWEVNEQDSARAMGVRDDCRRGLHELLAPDLFPIEVANALYSAELRGDILPGRFEHHLAEILRVGPVLYQSTSLLPRASTIIRRAVGTRTGIYDCSYVALAEREGCALITSDRRLINALQKDFPFITDLATMP